MRLHRTFVLEGIVRYAASLYGRLYTVAQFRHLCSTVQAHVMAEITREHSADHGVEAQRGALMGSPEHVSYMYSLIRRYLREAHIGEVEYPGCYTSLDEALFHEVWGYSVLAPWFSMPKSQSAKVIGDRVYFQENGRMKLQPYMLPQERRRQMVNAFLLNVSTASQRDHYVEMNLVTGERVTIYHPDVTKPGQDVMVFRKYIVERLSFEELAKLGTIPPPSVPLMCHMARVGFNVLFVGPVNSGKTTLLETWQSYEDPTLQGVTLEMTDEIPFHELLPGSPVMQLLVNEEELDHVVKPLLRSDADYLILAEARTAVEFDLMVQLANKGTTRCKTTLHTTDAAEVIYDIADSILRDRPNADPESMLMKVARSFHYVLQLGQLHNDKSQKRLVGIYEVCADRKARTITMRRICGYDYEHDTWHWAYHIGPDKRELARREDLEAFLSFEQELKLLARRYPIAGDTLIPVYGGGKHND